MSDDKAKAAFEAAQASGSDGTSKWDDVSETVKAAWRAAIETTRANDPKLVNLHATGTVGSMVGTNPNLNPFASQPPPPPTAPSPTAPEPTGRDAKEAKNK